MTKSSDQIAADAAKAAQLIKNTADQTATALNIQYIQRDMADMKAALEKLASAQDGKIEDLQKEVEALRKTVYIGMGIATAFAFAIPILVKFI